MQDFIEQAKKVKALILDVDGILTPGSLHYGPLGAEFKSFNIQDGLGIKLLQKIGITVAIISGRKSEAVITRAQELKIKHIFLGHESKLSAYEKIKQLLQLNDNEMAHMGDDLPDLALFKRVGFAATVKCAPQIMKDHAHYITQKEAGFGAVREVCDLIIHAQNRFDDVIQDYL